VQQQQQQKGEEEGEAVCLEACGGDEEWGWAQTKCLEQAVWSGKCNVARR
jgi:hypothetical protein